MSLSGKMWPVDGLDEKVEAVGRAGLKKAILPPLDDEQVQDPVTDIPDGVEVVHVSTVFEAINHMVIGEWANVQSVVQSS
jgi:ATP-dependent Lon protease